ncbi:MAG: hypothetical protein Q9195_001191 [Heterodermia aff. obscurata]
MATTRLPRPQAALLPYSPRNRRREPLSSSLLTPPPSLTNPPSPQIGNNEHPLILLALRRLDPAIQWSDIHMRMPGPGRGPLINFEALQILAETFYLDPWPGEGWSRPLNLPHPMWTRLKIEAIDLNSTRGYAPGLMYPLQEDATWNRIPWPNDVMRNLTMTSIPSPMGEFLGIAGWDEGSPAAASSATIGAADIGSLAETSSTVGAETFSLADTNSVADTIFTLQQSPTINITSPNFGHVFPVRQDITAGEWRDFWSNDEDRILSKEEIEDILKTPLGDEGFVRGVGEGSTDEDNRILSKDEIEDILKTPLGDMEFVRRMGEGVDEEQMGRLLRGFDRGQDLGEGVDEKEMGRLLRGWIEGNSSKGG